MELPDNVREWPYKPMAMPVTKDGKGPVEIGPEAALILYVIVDSDYNLHGEYEYLSDAINEAMRLSKEELKK